MPSDDPDKLLGEWLGELDTLIGVSYTTFVTLFGLYVKWNTIF